MRRFHESQISNASRRRLARCLIGLRLKDIERDLVLETLASTDGNRTISARLLGLSVRTLRNKIIEYSADGLDVPRAGSSARCGRGDRVGDVVTDQEQSLVCEPLNSR
jgi:Bacterial regulatory protein, Fis family